jgi:hypothetical protein
MSSRPSDSWITQPKREIKKQDSLSGLEGHELAGYTKPSGPTDRGRIQGTAIDMSKKKCIKPTTPTNLMKDWKAVWDPDTCLYYYAHSNGETTWDLPFNPKPKTKPKQPSIRQQKPTHQFYDGLDTPNQPGARHSPDLKKIGKIHDRLKKATDKKLEPNPLKEKDRQRTLPSRPTDKPPLPKPKETSAQAKKRRAGLSRALGTQAHTVVDRPASGTAPLQKYRILQNKQKKDRQKWVDFSLKEFYAFIKNWDAHYYNPRDSRCAGGKRVPITEGTHWRYFDVDHSVNTPEKADYIINRKNDFTLEIEQLNKDLFSKIGDEGKKYYTWLNKWHTALQSKASIRKAGFDREKLKQQRYNNRGPSRKPPAKPIAKKKYDPKPPATPVPVAKKVGVGENEIVSTKVEHKYRMASGADWIISQKNDETPILKIKSTGYTELYYQKDLPDNIKWLGGIKPAQFDANTLRGIPITTNPPPKGKFSSVPGFTSIDKYFFNIGNSKCFEYDDDDEGKALKRKMMKQNIRLEMRAGHVRGNIWRSNAGDASIWTQNLKGMSGYPKKGTIWDDSVPAKIDKSDKSDNVKDKEKLLQKTIQQIKHNGHKNFIIFSSPQTNYSDGFLDLNKKVIMGNGWYMLEFINNLDEMHLRDERYKGPEAKKLTPIVFFIKDSDIEPPKKNIDEWGKRRRILCEWEYRMEIIDELKKNDRMLTDIEKLVDFNTTERYCASTDIMRYSEYTNICSHNALSAKRKWQKESKVFLKTIQFDEFETFKTTIQHLFKGLGMANIIKPILDKGSEDQAAIVTEIEKQIDHIDILKFRMGKPNAAALPMPIQELKNIKRAVIEDVERRILEFFRLIKIEFDKLSEMQCTETDNCCDKTVQQLNAIIHFIASKTDDFNKIVNEFIEYKIHLGPILHMTTISDDDNMEIKKIIEDLQVKYNAYIKEWHKLIDGAKYKNTIIKLIKDKISQIVKFGKQERDDLTWVDTAGVPTSKKWKEMEIRQNEWSNHIICIKTLQENLHNFNIDKLSKDKEISDIILKFTSDINEISASFALVLSNYKQQHEKEITRIAEVAAAAEKAAEEERQRKIAEAEEAEKKKLEEEARIAKEKSAEEERQRIAVEKERKRQELDKALVKMIATWKEKLKEKELKDAEDTYRKELVIMYNEAIANNLKIKDEIETILEKLKGKEEKLKGEEGKSGSNALEQILLAEGADLTEIIKAFNKGDLKNQLQTTIDKLKNISTEAKEIRKKYETNNLITHSEDIQQFINGVDKKINNLQIWSDTINTDFFSESMELFNKEGNLKDDSEYSDNIKNSLNDNIEKLTKAEQELPQLVKGPIAVLKDKLNKHLIELNDKTHTNTVNVKKTLDKLEEKLKTQFDEYKDTCPVFQEDYETLISLYEEVDNILERKIKQETDVDILGKNEGDKYEKIKTLQQKVDEIDNQYKEKIKKIDKIILVGQFPTTTFFHKIIDEYDKNLYTGLITQIEAIDLSDIEEGVIKIYEDKQKELKITAESHNTEFQLYRSIVLGKEGDGLGYKGKEEELKIQQPAIQYDTLLVKLKGEDKSNDLCMRDLMKIKLLQWKTKAILKEDGQEHELMEEQVKTLKVAAEREAEIARQKEEEERQRKENKRIENERLAAITAARAVEETKLKELQDVNSNILTQMNELKEKIKTNQEIIEQRKEERRERRRLNNLQLQKILRHASPNLRKDLEKGNEKKWLAKNPGKERKNYKTEYLSEQVNTWG